MSWTDDLIDGLAQFLADQGIGTWSPGVVPDPAATSPVIVYGAVPDKPDVAIGLTPYLLQADPNDEAVTQPVQIWVRGTTDIRSVTAIADAVYQSLHGRAGLVFGSTIVDLAYLKSEVPIGIDGNRRRMQSLNYYFQTDRANASLPLP